MPGIVNRPFVWVTAEYVVPDGRCTATTRAPSTGVPAESVTTPAIADVVTPCERRGPAKSNAKHAAATRARLERTIQRMSGSLLRETGGTRAPIGPGESRPRPE